MENIRILKRKEFSIDHIREKLEQVDIAAIGHYTEFGFMDPEIKAMTGKYTKLYGSALTVRLPAQDSKALHLAASMVQPGDILVIDRSGDKNHACVGEMVALCAKQRGAVAIVIDGPMTDYEEIQEIGIPVFATGISGLTTKFIENSGEINDDVSCGGVVVHPGDLVMADKNGVLVLRSFEAETLIDTAIMDQDAEKKEKQEVMQGKTLQELYAPEYSL